MIRRLLHGASTVIGDVAAMSSNTLTVLTTPSTYSDIMSDANSMVNRVRAIRSPSDVLALSFETGSSSIGLAGNVVNTASRWAWAFTTSGFVSSVRDTHLASDPAIEQHGSTLGQRTKTIVEEVALEVRASLSLDRNTDTNDQATRALVGKTVWGILTDPKGNYKDLRRVDAAKLAPMAAELAMLPTQYELAALTIASEPERLELRSLAMAEQVSTPKGWRDRALQALGAWTPRTYVRAVQPHPF